MKKQSSDMDNWFETAKILSETLPFLQRYDDTFGCPDKVRKWQSLNDVTLD